MDYGTGGSGARLAAVVRTTGASPSLLQDTLQSLAFQSGGRLPVVIVEGDAESCAAVERMCGVSAIGIRAVIACGINAGLEYCLTQYPEVEFVFWLEAGDLAYPFFTSVMGAAFLASGADVVCAASNRREPGRATVPGYGCCAVRASALRDSGLRPAEELEQSADWHFLIQMVQAGFRFHGLTATLTESRMVAVADRDAIIADLRQRIGALESSLSWRWTAPVRRLLDALRGTQHV